MKIVLLGFGTDLQKYRWTFLLSRVLLINIKISIAIEDLKKNDEFDFIKM